MPNSGTYWHVSLKNHAITKICLCCYLHIVVCCCKTINAPGSSDWNDKNWKNWLRPHIWAKRSPQVNNSKQTSSGFLLWLNHLHKSQTVCVAKFYRCYALIIFGACECVRVKFGGILCVHNQFIACLVLNFVWIFLKDHLVWFIHRLSWKITMGIRVMVEHA